MTATGEHADGPAPVETAGTPLAGPTPAETADVRPDGRSPVEPNDAHPNDPTPTEPNDAHPNDPTPTEPNDAHPNDPTPTEPNDAHPNDPTPTEPNDTRVHRRTTAVRDRIPPDHDGTIASATIGHDVDRLARALLTRIAEPGDELLGRLIAKEGAAGAVEAIRAGLPPTAPFDPAQAAAWERRFAAWRARLPDAEPERLLAACEAQHGRLVVPGDAEWPSQLDDLGDARPYALWIRGDRDLRFGCLRSVAVVGSRTATSYGVHVAAELTAELADRGWAVVAGGAFGIDAAAHRGALAADGLTVAVFACGVDVSYPSPHEGLFAEIARDGLLVSELPPGTTPTRRRFLVRNRVIAALTRGTVVVEAARRSGALNTARHARDLRRAVMAVPGPVTSPVSAGCHTLLREWAEAVCVTDAGEVLDLVGFIGDDMAPERRGPVLDRDRLDPVTRDVLEAIPARGGAGTARIAVTAGVDLDTTLARLGALAAGGFVERCRKGWRLRREGPGP